MKRNSSDSAIKYVIMETKEDDAFYVDFMPQLWIVPMKKSVVLRERSCVNFSFPRRLPQQTKDSYIKFLKQAKFVGAVPDRSEKWDVKSGRILKMNLGSIEEALESQKFCSDYFSTTEAEVVTPAPSAPKKTVRKKKSVAPKKVETSESEDDNPGPLQVVSNYNARFAAENVASQSSFVYTPAAAAAVNVADLNLNQLYNIGTDAFEPQNRQFSELQQSIESVLTAGGDFGGDLSDLTNEIFVTVDVPSTNVPSSNDQVQTDNCYVDDQLTIVQDSGDQQTDCPHMSCCKGHQKILNKIDYVQKKMSKELSVVRQENASNRQLLLQVLELLGQAKVVAEEKSDDQIEDMDGELAHLDMSEVDRFNNKFNEAFPIESSEFILEFNKSLKDDQNFTDQLYRKLSTIKGEDETKTVRKILKVLCGVRCLKDFTWQGTKKMKSFTDLHLIIELITKLLEAKYPDCAPMDIISKVVKQRTKSAKEAWVGILAAEGKKDETAQNHSTTEDLISTDQTENENAAGNTDVVDECSPPDDGTNQQISE